jgi:hypothetical protein
MPGLRTGRRSHLLIPLGQAGRTEDPFVRVMGNDDRIR